MLIAQSLIEYLPSLRRFFVLLTGSSSAADAYVRRYIEGLIRNSDGAHLNGIERRFVFCDVIKLWVIDRTPIDPEIGTGGNPITDILTALGVCSPLARAAYLLKYVEYFTCDEIAAVLDTELENVDALVREAAKVLSSTTQPLE